jgi:hypothetical protein
VQHGAYVTYGDTFAAVETVEYWCRADGWYRISGGKYSQTGPVAPSRIERTDPRDVDVISASYMVIVKPRGVWSHSLDKQTTSCAVVPWQNSVWTTQELESVSADFLSFIDTRYPLMANARLGTSFSCVED